MPVARPTKKRKRTDPSATSSTVVRTSLTSLPLEILAEVLLYTCSPPTVLAVSRTCSFLYRTLALNPAASFIWRSVRETCKPMPLPDLLDRLGKTEAEYAAFVFGGGICEVCHKATRAPYVSFAVRIRLCGSWHCRKKFLKESIFTVPAHYPEKHNGSVWVPRVESDACFRRSNIPSTWPRFKEFMVRKTDWEKFKLDFVAYEAAQQARARCKDADPSTPPTAEEESAERIIERCNAAVQRFHFIMEVSVNLIHWKACYDTKFEEIKTRNRMRTNSLAAHEGWDIGDLVASQAYGSLQGRKNYLLEEIQSNDVSSIRSVIESELLAIQAHRTRQKSEAAYKKKLAEVKKIYERMRCGTPGKTSGLVYPTALPPPSVFFTLPSVRVLKGSPDPSAAPPNEVSASGNIKSSPLATSLIISDIHAWLVPVEAHLMRLLGYPKGWQSANTRAVSPLKRVTARFCCRRCGEGRVGRGYQRQLCLDLKGVCSHVCMAAQKKTIEDPHQGAPRDGDIDDTDASGGNEQEEGEKKGKKQHVKTPDWAIDVFEKDEKAIRIIKTILKLKGYSEEDPSAASRLNEMGGTIRCKACKGWIVMDFNTAIGHAHRHESMEIEIGPMAVVRHDNFLEGDHPRTAANSHMMRFAFKCGISELLLGPSHRARNLRKKNNYGCKHCFPYFYKDVGPGTVCPVKEDWKVMDFNGLRSHIKEKHGIQDIRDEDFFCFSPIDDAEGGKK